MRQTKNKPCDYRLRNAIGQDYRGPNPLNALIRRLGLSMTTSHTKFVPREIFKGTEAQIATFLSRLFAMDGWACCGKEDYRGEIGYCSVSRNLIDDVQSLLLKFGILSSVSTKRVKYRGTIRIAYQLGILAKADILKFVDRISIFGKEPAVQALVKGLSNRRITDNQKIRCIPVGVMSYIEEKRKRTGITKRKIVGGSTYDNQRLRNDAPCPRKLLQYAKNLDDDQYLKDLSQSDIVWDPVVEIVSVGEHETYDLSDVAGTCNFIANEVVVHNTTMIMIKALWHAFTHENSKVLILTPYDEQVKKIFWDRPGINFMIEESSTLASSVVGHLTKSPPYRIRFNNGSSITGMTAGTKSGSSGGASRGKDADFIILDEADYLDDNDLRTIMGVRIGNPTIKVIASSTPSGKRGLWYQWNTGDMWKVFHRPSAVVPYWDKVMDVDINGRPITFGEEILAGFDEYGIITEVLAEFPEELTGVFQKYYLDIMFGDHAILDAEGLPHLGDYSYPKKPNFRTNKRVMGVDVDKYGTGPEIVIIEYNEQLQKIYILDRVTMAKGKKGELTLHALVEKIIELDSKWKTSFVYVDRGYGEMVVEALHKHGKDHPETQLHKRVQSIFYGDCIDVPDPARRGVVTSIPVKPFIVNLAVRYTEQKRIVASCADVKLKRQMENYYVVARSTTTGQPRYTSKNEHALDALMFALYGMVAQFTDELIFPRGAKGGIIRSHEIGQAKGFGTYVDPWTDRVNMKTDARLRPDVLQLADLPAGAHKVATNGRYVPNRRVFALGAPGSRTAWRGHR